MIICRFNLVIETIALDPDFRSIHRDSSWFCDPPRPRPDDSARWRNGINWWMNWACSLFRYFNWAYKFRAGTLPQRAACGTSATQKTGPVFHAGYELLARPFACLSAHHTVPPYIHTAACCWNFLSRAQPSFALARLFSIAYSVSISSNFLWFRVIKLLRRFLYLWAGFCVITTRIIIDAKGGKKGLRVLRVGTRETGLGKSWGRNILNFILNINIYLYFLMYQYMSRSQARVINSAF